jgi:hypothetical protein
MNLLASLFYTFGFSLFFQSGGSSFRDTFAFPGYPPAVVPENLDFDLLFGHFRHLGDSLIHQEKLEYNRSFNSGKTIWRSFSPLDRCRACADHELNTAEFNSTFHALLTCCFSGKVTDESPRIPCAKRNSREHTSKRPHDVSVCHASRVAQWD